MRTSIVFTFLASALTVLSKAVKPNPNFHIYLAFGQSNMEGQGPAEVQDRIAVDRFKLLSTADQCMGRELGEWYVALPPIVNCYGNIGPLDYFGRTLVERLPKEITVGVVPVAIAGCDIQLFEEANYKSYEQPDWMVGRVESYGGNPYRRLVNMAKKAQESGVIKGILLHQGETNNGQLDWPDRVKAIYESLLKELDLKAEDVPLLAGEVVREEKHGLCSAHNEVIKMLPDVIPTAHVISAEGLDQQGDDLHFTSAAYRVFGERYAEKMLELLDGKKADKKEDKKEDKKDDKKKQEKDEEVSKSEEEDVDADVSNAEDSADDEN